MTKLDIFGLSPLTRRVVTRTFTCDGPERAVTLSLRRADPADMAAAVEIGNRLVDTYITGATRGEPCDFPYPELQSRLTRHFFYTAATIAVMQEGENRAELYTPEEICGMAARCPQNFAAIQDLANELNREAADDLGK